MMTSAFASRARTALCALYLATAPMSAAPVTARTTSGSGSDSSYVVLMPGDHASTFNGTSADFERAKSLRSGDAGLIYVRQNGTAYVVRDAAMLRRAQAILAPQQALGERQGALGREQGELGRRQGSLGAEQARASLSQDSARRMADLGRQQAALGAQQAKLGARQAELGRQQAAAAKAAERQFKDLIADAVRLGLAQRVQ